MKTRPIVAARLEFEPESGVPYAPEFGDVYHARAGALAQARHVFLGGNGLPQRWQGRARFVILETGFGLGNNFLATWAAWAADPQRCERLVFISIEKHPLSRADLRRAHAASPEPQRAAALVEAWPPLTPNLHRLGFEAGRVQLMLCLGEARDWLAELLAQVDAFYLDGFAPAKNPAMWDPYLLKRLARLAAPEACAATWSVAREVHEGLRAAGFEPVKVPGFASKGRMTVAQFRPRHQPAPPAGRLALAPRAREVLVLGAGLAGAAAAAALRAQGLAVRVLERSGHVASGASGNPLGLFHGTLNPDDGLHARFNRACALHTQRRLAALPPLARLQQGLLRLETRLDLPAMQSLLARLGLPPDYVQAWSPAEAATASGLALTQPAWYYPGGGALPPAAYAQALLADTPLRCATVSRLRRRDSQWQLLDAGGAVLDQTEALVLACGHQSQVLLQDLAPAGWPWPLVTQRGQLSGTAIDPQWPGPRLPLAGRGYAIAEDGQLWCGASADDDDTEPALRQADHVANLAQYRQLAGLPPLAGQDLPPLQGRVGWRLLTPDRLPLVGGLPEPGYRGRADQVRLLPRLPGLAICSALGGRAIWGAGVWGDSAAAQLSGAPLPLETGLLDALDPARFALQKLSS